MHDVCEKYQIMDKIQVNTDVTEVRRLDDDGLWEATLAHMVPGMGDLSSKDRSKLVAS